MLVHKVEIKHGIVFHIQITALRISKSINVKDQYLGSYSKRLRAYANSLRESCYHKDCLMALLSMPKSMPKSMPSYPQRALRAKDLRVSFPPKSLSKGQAAALKVPNTSPEAEFLPSAHEPEVYSKVGESL